MGALHSGSTPAGPPAAPPPVALTIAGSDPSGGAGIQADLKTFLAFRTYGAAVITSLTVQDTATVHDRTDVPPAFVIAQLAAVQRDLPVAAAKTGLLGTRALVDVLADHLAGHPLPRLVVDPVLVATSGDALTAGDTVAALRTRLLPHATLVTPNLAEAAALTGRRVDDLAGMRDAARALGDCGAGAVLVKGGHLSGAPRDVLLAGGALHEIAGERVGTGSLHGTGCTLSAAIAAGLAHGDDLEAAVRRAKRYVERAIAASAPLGHGSRPLDHRVVPDDT
jgi:hydroxymethylpyrimidine/phosphomethylpyrimidine kinase